MKRTITLLFFSLSYFSAFTQVQQYAPWNQQNTLSKKKTTTLNEISEAAEAYFKTIDRNKKGSGLKPFKRWENHWSHYLKPDGTIAPASDLWNAWQEKQELSKLNRKNSGDWKPLGPYSSSNTSGYASKFQQTGQGRVNAIAVDPNNPNTYYVGSPAGGIWKSTDAGLNWQPLTDYLPQIGVSGIAITPSDSNIIYIATGDDDANDSYASGVWKSIDGGNTWNNTGDIPGNPSSMNEIYVNPNNNETVLVATNTGVQKTTNGGTTWTTRLNAQVIDLKMKPGDPNTWYAITSDKFYKSIDGGDTFTEKAITGLTNSSRMAMDVTIADSNIIYIVSANNNRSGFNGIYKSIDSGETFTRTNETDDIFESTQAWYDLAITVSSSNANRVYVGVLDIWQSVDGGNNFFQSNRWSDFDSKSYTHADIHFLRFFGNNLFAGTDGGIYISNDHGVSFTDLTKNIAISQFYKISISQNQKDLIAGGLQDNGGFAFTDNNWYNYHGGDGMEGLVSPVNQKKYYGFTQYGGSLNISTSGGKSRNSSVNAPSEETGPGDPGGDWITPLVSDSNGVLYAGYSQVYKLVDDQNWVKVSNFNFGGDISGLEIDPNNNNIIYAYYNTSNGLGRLYRSIDAGVNFELITATTESITSIEINNNNSDIAWLTTSSKVLKSVNIKSSPASFNDITANLPSEGKNIIKHHIRGKNNTIYLGTNLGVYYTDDSLSEWKTFDNGLPNTKIVDLEIHEEESILYAATYGRGVFSTLIPRELPNSDVKLVSINAPESNSITTNNDIEPLILVKNQGKQVITNINIEYNFNNGSVKSQTWSGSLNSENETQITLPIETLPLGYYNLNVTVNTTGDAYSNNNTSQISFLVNKTNTSPSTPNSFENNDDALITQNDLWELGTVNKTLLKTPSGTKAYATKLTGNHPDKTTGYLYTNYYDLTKIANPTLKFKMAFDIEQDWDHLYVEYSVDKGNNWNILGTASDANWYNSSTTTNSNGQPLPGKQWTGEGEDNNPLGGTNATVHDYSYNLTSFTSQSSIIFRFVFVADDATNEEGAVIDDLVIEGTLSNEDIKFSESVIISPNPSKGIFNLKLKSEGNKTNIIIYDITGKKVFSDSKINEDTYKLDLSNYNKGIYLLNIKSNGKAATKKLIIN